MIPYLQSRLYCLAEIAGGPRNLWEANKKDLIDLGLSIDLVSKILTCRRTIDLDTAYKELLEGGIAIITDEDDPYPELLRQSQGHPKALFTMGDLKSYDLAIAIVGSRRSTPYGKALASELGFEMAKAGIAIVSGAARGIDTAAHLGAIEAGGLTFAVLGCGIDIVYPPENKNLYRDIASSGALISEYATGTVPYPSNFPARNRIVAGMCQGVVVVEAAEKSGALITVDFALDYGRDVFAVPGFIRNKTSRGTNGLIKQGAYLVESANDIFEILGIETMERDIENGLSIEEKTLLDVISCEPKHMDEISQITGKSISSISASLISLEIMGLVKKDIAGGYLRIR